MRTMQDSTMERYAAAAAALPPETVRAAIAACDTYAAHPDDAADALPFVLITLADAAAAGRVAPMGPVTMTALTSARRQRERDTLTAPPVDVDTLPDTAAPAAPAASGPMLEDVLPTLPPTDAAMLAGIADAGIRRVIKDRARTHRTMPDGRRVGDPVGAPIPMTRRALRVGDIAASVGAPIPRTRAASDALRAAASVAWARASVAMGTAHKGETVESRALRAMRYVTTDAATLAAAYRRERDLVAGGTAGTVSPEMVRRLGWVAPTSDPVSGSLTRSMPEPRKGAPTRSRKGLVTASTSTRYAGGVSEGAAHGALVAGVSTDAGVLALARAARAHQREDAAYAAHAARADAGVGICRRPLPLPTSALGTADAAEWECGCGAATGRALVSVWMVPADAPTAAPVRDHRHPLTPCEAPAATHDAGGTLTGHRCGCGRKRGALVRQREAWCHRAR